MGKGDRKSTKGKRFRSSFGVTRKKTKRNLSVAEIAALPKKKAAAKKPTAAKAASAKKAAAKKRNCS